MRRLPSGQGGQIWYLEKLFLRCHSAYDAFEEAQVYSHRMRVQAAERREEEEERHNAAAWIQHAWRGVSRVFRAACTLQRAWRGAQLYDALERDGLLQRSE